MLGAVKIVIYCIQAYFDLVQVHIFHGICIFYFARHCMFHFAELGAISDELCKSSAAGGASLCGCASQFSPGRVAVMPRQVDR